MIHHVSLGTNDLDRARAFYDPVMALLGLRLIEATDRSLLYGTGEVLFSIKRPVDGRPASPGSGVHVAFIARDQAMVRAFHTIGLAHDGQDAGEPGPRPNYDPNYFAAFLLDPDGNKVEAVTFSAR